jgi:hypothetical protein
MVDVTHLAAHNGRSYPPAMTAAPDLFALSPDLRPRMELLGGKIPVLLLDDFFADPDAVRAYALEQEFNAPPYPYPGRLALAPEDNPSLQSTRQSVLELANQFLSRVPPIANNGQRLTSFLRAFTDFAVVDVHPNELSDAQRLPHTDPVPVFGLVYLNCEERGGTLFFEQKARPPISDLPGGYLTESTPEYELCGRIEPAFNRLAIYPGFIPHSGEIRGDWIQSEERYSSPRLTQRFVFFP